MLSYLQGTVTHISDQHTIIDVNGIGFGLNIAHTRNLELNQKTTLFIYLHWNPEHGPALFGFYQEFERQIFELIISCSGIGPKIALAILRDLGVKQFLHAINSHDIDALSTVSGISTKKAEQLIVALKGKVTKLITSGNISIDDSTALWKDINNALISLNYSRPEINHTMSILQKQTKESSAVISFEATLRKALSLLSKQG